MPTIDFQMGKFLVHLDLNKSSHDVPSGKSEILILSAVDVSSIYQIYVM